MTTTPYYDHTLPNNQFSLVLSQNQWGDLADLNQSLRGAFNLALIIKVESWKLGIIIVFIIRGRGLPKPGQRQVLVVM